MKRINVTLVVALPVGTYKAKASGNQVTFRVEHLTYTAIADIAVKGTVPDEVYVKESGFESKVLGKLHSVGLAQNQS